MGNLLLNNFRKFEKEVEKKIFFIYSKKYSNQLKSPEKFRLIIRILFLPRNKFYLFIIFLFLFII